MESSGFARPLYERRLEKAFNLEPFLNYVEHVIDQSVSDSDEDSDSELFAEFQKYGLDRTNEEAREDRAQMYNFSCVRKKRQWLKDTLLSASDSEEDDDRELTQVDLQNMLHEHKLRKKFSSTFYQKEENKGYLYYSAGLLSRVDRYPEHQKFLAGSKRKRNREKKDKERQSKQPKETDDEFKDENSQPSTSQQEVSLSLPEETSEDLVNIKCRSKPNRKDKKPKKLDAQALAIKRHKLWVFMAKKEVGRCQKSKASYRKEVLQNCKKMATGCMRFCRHKALQSQKTVKDKVWLLKRLTRTMQTEWKKFDRIMKEQNKRAEREAEEQRKIDKEILEAKRQQRKVNFLITLPELYAHFMKNKVMSDSGEDHETNSILKQLEDEKPLPASVADDYNSGDMKAQAMRTAKEAYTNQQSRVSAFANSRPDLSTCDSRAIEHPQPDVFVGQLKSYQLKGMNWLANLYYFGINGILADEMGLGKTVQSVAFLAHICEEYDTWGPFLIVTPASTLHNWTCEITRFVPNFKVVPYWGNPEERKNLRKFFDGKNLGSEDASFHIVVTSYQIVIQDFKFLNRLKWNYMILDEAQAIKSINSQRWKQLLGFSCRNRLLLSGTPIQNSMAELWALLHFIMPTLFDSHSWFNEWFSKDIEGHVENKTAVDEKHLNRLHKILKPFMLRRVKTEVENELSDKIEIMMYCPLTLRQKFLYEGLRNKISIDELLKTSSLINQSQQSATTSLMNLVMQFRKVCNHPELLERREVQSAYTLFPEPYLVPKLIFREGFIHESSHSRNHLLYNRFSIYHPSYVRSSLAVDEDSVRPSCFSFLRFVDLSIGDVASIVCKGLIARFLLLLGDQRRSSLRHYHQRWRAKGASTSSLLKDMLLVESPTAPCSVADSEVFRKLIFCSHLSPFYAFKDHLIHHVPESLNHRLMRLQKQKLKAVKIEEIDSVSPEGKDAGSPAFPLVKEPPMPNGADPTGGKISPQKSPSKSPKKSNKLLRNKLIIKKEPICVMPAPADAFRSCGIFRVTKAPFWRTFQPTAYPTFLLHICSKAQSTERDLYCYDSSASCARLRHERCSTAEGLSTVMFGSRELEEEWTLRNNRIRHPQIGGLLASRPLIGWNHIIIPDKHTLIMDAGKLFVLDTLLSRLKVGDHRVLIYSQMTKMIDVLEEYMWHRKHKYMRLDGSSKISDRRDMVDDFQNKADIFVFLLSTRAGGVGINLTAADTVIFYDSDWNPTVDQQAMDRAHRLGQTKQVTVYRLICKATIEERILQRAREKSEIQRMVISGGNFKPDTLKPKEVVSLLLDDDIEREYRSRQKEKRAVEDYKLEVNREKMRERMRKRYAEKKYEKEEKRRRLEDDPGLIDVCGDDASPGNSSPASPAHSESSHSPSAMDEGTSDSLQIVDVEGPVPVSVQTPTTPAILMGPLERLTPVAQGPVRGQRKRGRPRGSGLRGRSARNGDLNAIQGVNGVPQAAEQSPSQVSVVTSADQSSPGSNGTTLKRGRGRPRLLPLGPGHQGTRPPTTLPVALGSLASNAQDSNNSLNKSFKFYN